MNRRTSLVALAGALLIAGGFAVTAAAAPTGVTSDDASKVVAVGKGSLDAGKLAYHRKCWGVKPSPGHGCEVSAVVPKAWKLTKLSTYHARFDDSSRTWMLRIDGNLPGTKSTSAAALAKQRALRGTPGLKVISRVSAKVRSDLPDHSVMAVTTLTYSYTDGARGTRLVTTRYVAPYEQGAANHAYIEITAAGGTKDKAGLQALVTKATKTVALAG
ncbi:hypothetical protein OG394_28860 [Kribbella sp. NBC_01245]|uniref:hypothetical protein n=1 Tax=Kribbella sp. NBC_01245 TaxID=2903578 RepID=UPI002E2CD686|nr:hypothetical protein [Kribbella sp. NBC_01245]